MKTNIVVLTVAAPIVTAGCPNGTRCYICGNTNCDGSCVINYCEYCGSFIPAVARAGMSLTFALTAVVASVGDNARQPGAVTVAVLTVTVRAVIVVTVAVLTATVRAVPLRLVLIAVLTIVQGNATIPLQLSAPVVINRNVCATGARNVAR